MKQWICAEEPDGVRTARGSDLEPRAVDWLWKYWLPRGAISILAGAPGTGKTSLALAVATIVSAGSAWPDDSVCAGPGQVVIWSGEDDIQATLLPRLISMGADLSRVHFVTTTQEQGRSRAFDPAVDMRQLMFKICEISEVDVVILDPLISVVAGDTNKAGDVRDALEDLITLANSGPAVLGITHFSKGSKASSPLDRVLGSQAFSAVARVVLVTVKRPVNDERMLLRAKSNLGPDGDGFIYSVQPRLIGPSIESTAIVWGEGVEGDVEALMRDLEEENSPPRRLDEAKEFLKNLLSAEGLPATKVYEQAQAAGHAASTVTRAKASLGVKVRKLGGGGWIWRLGKEIKDA